MTQSRYGERVFVLNLFLRAVSGVTDFDTVPTIDGYACSKTSVYALSRFRERREPDMGD